MRSDLAKGSISGALQVVVTGILVLVAVPLFVRLRGDEAFGLYSLLALVGSVNSFANLGLNVALVRFLSEQGKGIDSDTDILVTLFMLLTTIVPLTVAGFVFEDAVVRHVLKVPEHLYSDGVWLYRGGLISNVLVLLGQTFTAVLDADGKVYLTNLLQVMYTVLYWGAILLILVMGLPLGVIGGATVLAAGVWFACVATGMTRIWGVPSTAGLSSMGRVRARRQLGYGIHLFTAGGVSLFAEPLMKLLLAHFFGLREVGIYDIGVRARNIVNSLAQKLMYPLYPLFAQTSDRNRLQDLVSDVEQKTSLLFAPLPGLALIATPAAVALVFGPGRLEITTMIVWMVSVYLLMSATVTPVYIFLMARGFASRTVLVQFVSVVGNGLGFLLTFSWLGYQAAIAGTAAATAAGWVLLLFYQKEYVGTMVFGSWSQRGAFIVVLTASVGIGVLVDWIGGNILSAVIGGIVICAMTILVYRSLGTFTPRDVERYVGTSSGISRFVKRMLCTDVSVEIGKA